MVISTKSLGSRSSPAARACAEGRGGGRGGQKGTRQAVPRDRSTQLKFVFRWLLTEYLINLLKTNLPTGYCWKFQLPTFPLSWDCSSKWPAFLFHWILPFLVTSFPQPFLSRMQFWLRSALDLNLAYPLPPSITKVGKVCLHIVLISLGRWVGKTHVLRNLFVQKLRNETWWQNHQFSIVK